MKLYSDRTFSIDTENAFKIDTIDKVGVVIKKAKPLQMFSSKENQKIVVNKT